MAMRLSLAFFFVIAVTTAALGQSGKAAVQSLDYVTDSEAHLIYAAVVSGLWATGWGAKDPIVLRRETEDVEAIRTCSSVVPSPDPEWAEVQKHFWQENSRRKVLPLALPFSEPYRLITLAELEQLDAPLKLKYPENLDEHPEAFQYAAVSAVGFNADKTKAMVYVRLRDKGNLSGLERRDGKWVTAPKTNICTWIA